MEKPKKVFTTFRRLEGRYNLLDPGQKSAQYVFEWAPGEDPKDVVRSFLVNMDYDWCAHPSDYTALELAWELQRHYERDYLFTKRLEEAKALVAYLEAREEQDRLAKLEYDVRYAEYMVSLWQANLETAHRILTQELEYADADREAGEQG